MPPIPAFRVSMYWQFAVLHFQLFCDQKRHKSSATRAKTTQGSLVERVVDGILRLWFIWPRFEGEIRRHRRHLKQKSIAPFAWCYPW